MASQRRGAWVRTDGMRNCVLCPNAFVKLGQHLIKRHGVVNRRERELLLHIVGGRSSRKLNCVVCGRKQLVRLDKHIQSCHPDINGEGASLLLSQAKRRANLKALMELRLSSPVPAMSSLLDYTELVPSSDDEEEVEVDEQVAEPTADHHSPAAGQVNVDDHPVPEPTPPSQAGKEVQMQTDQQPAPPSQAGKEVQMQTDQQLPEAPPEQPERRCDQCSWYKARLAHMRHRLRLLHRARSHGAPAAAEEPGAVPGAGKASGSGVVRGEPKFAQVLHAWLEHMGGEAPKQRENARQKATHVNKWVSFMSPAGVPRMDLGFLRNRPRLTEWSESLSPYAVTTRRVHVLSVKAFLEFLIRAQLPEVRAPLKCLRASVFWLEGILRRLSKGVVAHRQAVRSDKSGHMLDAAHIDVFIKRAAAAIPGAMDVLERDMCPRSRERIFGLLAGYAACLTGHRRGVLENILTSEVEGAVAGRKDHLFLIKVARHKTAGTYGHAMLPLTAKEHAWFLRLVRIRVKLSGASSERLFINTSGGPYQHLLRGFQRSWSGFGLPGAPTFGLLRSAISTYVGRGLENREKEQVRRSMCHSTSTAEAFYEAEHDLTEAWACRELTSKALQMQVGTPRFRAAEEKDKMQPVVHLLRLRDV